MIKITFNISKAYTYKQGNELYTPSNAITPLIKYIPTNAVVWECAEKETHDGNITIELLNAGIKVITTSIHTGDDFLTCTVPEGVTHIITNPAYDIKNEFIKRCYEIGLPFALLLPIQALDTETRFNMFKNSGIEIMVFNKRVKYINGGNSPAFASAWFCHKILPQQLVFEELIKTP